MNSGDMRTKLNTRNKQHRQIVRCHIACKRGDVEVLARVPPLVRIAAKYDSINHAEMSEMKRRRTLRALGVLFKARYIFSAT